MPTARLSDEQRAQNGVLAGGVALLVTLLGDEKVSPFHMMIAFAGGYLVGSRPLVLAVEEEDPKIEVT